MLSKFYPFRKILCLALFFSCLLLHSARAQTYANSQTNGVTGLCLLCGVTTPENAVNSNPDDFSTFNISVGLLGVTVYQTLIFPSGSTAGCDSLVIGVGSGNSLLSVNLVGGVTVQTFNGAVANNDAHVVDTSNFRSWGNNRGEIRLKPAASFDRVKVTLSSSLVGLLNALQLYYAYRKPALPPPVMADTIQLCKGDTAAIAASVPAGTTVHWYNAPTGGTLLYTGASYKVSPAVTTTYYADAALSGCTSARKSTTVKVNPKPANPEFSVTPSIICSSIGIGVANYTPDVYYNVRTVYTGIDGLLLDSSFTVPNSDTVVVRDLGAYLNVTVNLYIQAVNKITGCRSDTVMQTMIFGAHGTYADVDTNNVTICKGDSITLHAYGHGQAGNTVLNIRWYSVPTGGTELHRGQYFTVAPPDTTNYYVVPGYYCEYPRRTKVTVNVRKLPEPVFSVPQGMTCGVTKIKIQNYQPGYSYNVRVRFRYSPQILHDTSFFVPRTDTFSTPPFLPPLPAAVDIWVQAVDSITGCRSDSAYRRMNTDGYAQKPSVTSDSVIICRGDSVVLHAFAPIYTLARIRWYDVPTGGSRLFTGGDYKVSPQNTTVYYAAAGYGCEYPERTPVKVVVTPCVRQVSARLQKDITLKHTLELFPNPSAGEVRLNTSKLSPGSLIIVRNIHGVEVQRSILTGNSLALSTQLANGIYFIEIRNGVNEVYRGRVVLKR
ncbi:T9SS type A sorting domain-containing protein [Chitinophaga varians]|uniref:T9SS type A sorting domain-containing protein n=1 Tax=Chitinophaga varians TaxID=2202339 RepID=A0A847RH58_9BACT|nr:T9SS type A sorting domain-containing protein [Chitinophaga varians]NLR66379.1 T9SS type A sorting domain-containing protein [Chitinophaga varians]